MANAYLDRLTGQHEEIRARIETLHALSVSEDRELTEDELRSVTEDSEKAKILAGRITEAHEDATRSAAVAALAPVASPTQTRSSSTTADDRDPGHYRSIEDGGDQSFFGDMFRSRFNYDEGATRRLQEHSRAQLGTSTAGGSTAGNTGVIPPKWMTDLYLPLSRQARVLASQVTPLSLGNDPRPIVLPLQTAGTDSEVVAQTEGTAVTGDAQFQTNTETLTPNAIAGKQIVTRQLLDSTTPAIDALIVNDLQSVYDKAIEVLVCNALVTASSAAVTFATNQLSTSPAVGDFTFDADAIDAVSTANVAVWEGIFESASLIAVSPSRYAAYRKLRDGNGRPFLSTNGYGPVNTSGLLNPNATNGLSGEIEGLPVFQTTGLGLSGVYPNYVLVLKASDAILAESDAMQFRFEEVQGPQNIVLGLWRYAGVVVRRAGAGVKSVKITAAT